MLTTGECIEDAITTGKIAYANGDVYEGGVYEDDDDDYFAPDGQGTMTRCSSATTVLE